jgi:hypothetical protein
MELKKNLENKIAISFVDIIKASIAKEFSSSHDNSFDI